MDSETLTASQTRSESLPGQAIRLIGILSFKAPLSSRIDPRHAVERGKKVFPCFALLDEYFLACGSELVKTAATLSGFLDPAALNETAFLKSIEQWIKRSNVELQHAPGALFD